MDGIGEHEHGDDSSRPEPDEQWDADQSELLRYLVSLPEPPDSPRPEPSLHELLEESAIPGGSDRIAAEARRLDPGPLTAQMLAVIHPTRLGAKGLLDAACAAERLASWTQATQHRYIAAFARPGVAAPMERLVDYASAPGQPLHRSEQRSRTEQRGRTPNQTERDLTSSGSAVHGRTAEQQAVLTETAVKIAASEVSAALLVSPINANRRISQAVDFNDDLPATLAALRDGVIDRGRAMVIADRTQNLSTDLRRRVEARIVPKAAGRTAGQIRGIADRAVIAADPAAAQKRLEAARTRRGISIRPGEDGMSIFRADLTADKSVTAFTVIDQIAMANARNSAEKRPIGALRADAFADIFDQLASHGSVHLFGASQRARPKSLARWWIRRRPALDPLSQSVATGRRHLRRRHAGHHRRRAGPPTPPHPPTPPPRTRPPRTPRRFPHIRPPQPTPDGQPRRPIRPPPRTMPRHPLKPRHRTTPGHRTTP